MPRIPGGLTVERAEKDVLDAQYAAERLWLAVWDEAPWDVPGALLAASGLTSWQRKFPTAADAFAAAWRAKFESWLESRSRFTPGRGAL